MYNLVELIAIKRDGGELSPPQVKHLINAFVQGDMADYQMSAFLMAAFLRGMSDIESVALTEAMLNSGQVLDLSDIPGIKVDKHSTGGVGDKVSIALVPIVAACGVPVPMISGRGLGHTGGTLDKLEAIPGFNVNLDPSDFARIISDVGGCMIGQTEEVAPADKRIYALRDVTATVESVPLIVASILSKKLAEGIDALVLDVKVGKGAFMKDLAQARTLASALVRVGTRANKRVVAVLTRMDAPLGRAIGNALETREAIDVLFGHAPADLTECTHALCAEMLMLGGKAQTTHEALEKIRGVIADGSAADVMERMIAAQGGDPAVVRKPEMMAQAPHIVAVPAPKAGAIVGIDAMEMGLSAVALGAGRTRADQKVDPAVGIVLDASLGDTVDKGAPLAHIHARSSASAKSVFGRITGAFEIGPQTQPRKSLVIERIES
ncbi:MAG: thymidine phosphorylase [Sorangium cellulosum]|nr:MAG: thymidine phosphorylase [Sorangium cellulosum]